MALNKVAGVWNEDLLNDLLIELQESDFNMFDFGFDFDFDELEEKEVIEDNFNIEIDETKETIVKKGQLWKLGNHYLMCGDSTNKNDIEKLTQGKTINLVFTDPPYGINIVNNKGKVGGGNVAKAKVYSKVIADNSTEAAKKSYMILKTLCDKLIIWGGNYFIDFLDVSDSWLIWDKRCGMNSNNFADGELAYCSFHTPVRIYRQLWNGMIREGEKEERVHPTQKPVKMLSDILRDFSNENDIVLDVFGGSGSTLIACEKTKRTCYLMELDERYCDIIISRWEKLTNNKAELIKI